MADAPAIWQPLAGETGLPCDCLRVLANAFTGGASSQYFVQWQVALTADTTFADPVYDSKTRLVNERWLGAQAAVLPVSLLPATTYRVRVRRRGDVNVFEAWSAAVVFTTRSELTAEAARRSA